MLSGAEAVETAFKLVRKWAYMRKSSAGHRPYVEGVAPRLWSTIRCNNVYYLERALELNGENTDARISLRSLLSAVRARLGAIVVPDEGYLSRVHALCKKHNVLFVCQKGCPARARCSRASSTEYDVVRPDMVFLGKSMCGGETPGCAVALTALRVLLDEQLAARAFTLGTLFRDSILALRSPLVAGVRARGLLNAVTVLLVAEE
ncbi:pyridoxal phosphate-dependent transferase [Mycena vitilis]|nr:pyridoxal phosphate-dependent transferase [Mycena vitilis]